MNDEFADLESDLRRLEPRVVSRQLKERVAVSLDHPTNERNASAWWQRLGFSRASAAFGWGVVSPALTAALVIVFTHLLPAAPSPSPSSNHASVGASEPEISSARTSNVVYQALDEGVVYDAGQEPVHRLRYRSADLVRWRNPTTGVHWEVSYPREDVMLVPIQVE